MKLYFNKRNQKLTEKKNSSQAIHELEFAQNNNVLCELLFTNDSLSTVAPSALSFGLFDSVDGNLLAFSNNFDYDTNILTIPLNTSELSAFLGLKVSRKAYAEFRFDWGEDTLTTLGLPARVFNTFLNGDEQPPSSLIFEYPTSSEFSELSADVVLINQELTAIDNTLNQYNDSFVAINDNLSDLNNDVSGLSNTVSNLDIPIKTYGTGSICNANFVNPSDAPVAKEKKIKLGNCAIVNSNLASVIGGNFNKISSCVADNSAIVGGSANDIKQGTATNSVIFGGCLNLFESSCSDAQLYNNAIIGGKSNLIKGDRQQQSAIVGGLSNTIESYYGKNVIVGGCENIIKCDSQNSAIIGGSNNTVCADNVIIAGSNITADVPNTLYVSQLNVVGDACLAGFVNGAVFTPTPILPSGTNSIFNANVTSPNPPSVSNSINFGDSSTVNADYSNISGGTNNTISGTYATNSNISGGSFNTISGGYATNSFIGGGNTNIISGDFASFASIVGGDHNTISGSDSSAAFIGGGYQNTINGTSLYSGILAGRNNTVCHSDSFVVGSNLTTVSDCATHVNNLIVTSPTLTTSSPFSLNQTWNDSGVVFTGIKQSITDTASSSSSLLMDLQVGGVSNFRIKKDGGITTAASSNLDGGVRIGGGTLAFGYASDVVLLRPAANILSLRNSTNPQEFQIYGTYTNTTSYERMIIKGITSSNFQIGTEKGSSGGTARGLDLVTDGTVRWTIGTDGSFVASTPGAYVQISSAGTFRFGGSGSRIKSPSNGQMTLYNAAENDFNLLQFGGNASNRPAIRRNGTSLDIVLADSSAYTNLYAKNLVQLPASTITPANNGEMVFEATSNTSITVKMKGSDGVVRTGTITLS